MKKILYIILCAAIFITITGCETEQQRQAAVASKAKEHHEKEQSQYWESRETEIQQVDEWGISLDDVDRLAKDAIHKHEMQSKYKSDYNKITKEIDSFLNSVILIHHQSVDKSQALIKRNIAQTSLYVDHELVLKVGGAAEYNLDYLLKKHSEACQFGIEYIQSSYDVKVTYDLFMTDGQLNKSEKDVLRTMLTTWNRSIKEIEQSESDMKSLLDPIILENRKLTTEEVDKVYDIYHILTDIIMKVN